MRICSLIPSGTEILFSLGLGDQVIGVTEYCNYPPEAKSRLVVSRGRITAAILSSRDVDRQVQELVGTGIGTYALDSGWLQQEKPDLILSQDLCLVCDLQAQEVMGTVDSLGIETEVLVLGPSSLSDILNNVLRVGRATGRESRAEELVSQLRTRIDKVASMAAHVQTRPRVLCLEWLDPLTAGGHWIPEMVAVAGGVDGLVDSGAPAKRVSWEQVVDYAPDVIMLIPCAMDMDWTLGEVKLLAQKEGWWDIPAVMGGNVFIVYSDFYSVPGPRIVTGLEIMAQLIHPELFSGMVPTNTGLKLEPPGQGGRLSELIDRCFRPYS